MTSMSTADRRSTHHSTVISQPGKFYNLSQRGFSLIELMVAVALSLFLLAGLQMTYLSGRAASQEAEDLSRMQENIRFASDYLVRDVRNAGYRDLLTLTFNQDLLIGESYAQYGANGTDQSRLIIRYAGRGACGRNLAVAALKVIENHYFVAIDDDGRGHLICDGFEFDEDLNPIDPDGQRPVTLASGLVSANFQFLFAPGETPSNVCDFDEPGAVQSACQGVDMTLVFEGDPERTIVLTAAFRNVILERIFAF